MTSSVIDIENVTKVYQMGEVKVHALCGLSLSVQAGEMLSIMGPSGSGKSTLFNMIGGLDTPTGGHVTVEGCSLSDLSSSQLAWFRCRKIGFIFQSYNLIQQLSVIENIEVPLYYQGRSERESRRRATALGELVGLGDRLHHRPHELSGGQQQRVAVARAIVGKPLILLADEPTGNLDRMSAAVVFETFFEMQEAGHTIIVVTHDRQLVRDVPKVMTLQDGLIEASSLEAAARRRTGERQALRMSAILG